MTSHAGTHTGEGEERMLDQDVCLSSIGRELAGNCDRIEGANAYGWARSTTDPGRRLKVEQWVDGVLAGAAIANRLRADLREKAIGDGKYGWLVRIALDPYKTRPQRVEIRLTSGELLSGGAFELTFDPSMLDQKAKEETQAIVEAQDESQPEQNAPLEALLPTEGAFDGLDGDIARGWAWRPDFPEEHVAIEQWVRGKLADTSIADLSRPDLGAAGKGHGRYGWQMQVVLDPDIAGKQTVEFRIKGGDLVADSQLELSCAEIAPVVSGEASAGAMKPDAPAQATGWYDGLKGATLHGWAWNPTLPDEQVEVELWIDGALVRDTVANGFRPDLRANGVGHGRYGWRLPLELDPDRNTSPNIEIRIKGGPIVGGGVFELRNDLSLDDPANAALKPFVLSVLEPAASTKVSRVLPRPKTALLVHCAQSTEAGKFWAREYDDYRGAMQAFVPVLCTLGEVIEVKAVSEANAVCEQRRAKGEECVLFSFGSPRQAPLDATCPVIPVLSWPFPTIPTGMWDGDRRSDWRHVLRTTARAITLSQFAADAVKSAMGADYPVISIPVPIADRTSAASAAVVTERTIAIDGVVFDSRDHVFDANRTDVPSPVWSGAAKQSIAIEGVLFTVVLDLNDGRRSWKDALSAFVVAHQDNPDATLLLKLDEPNADWWHEVYKGLARLPRFSCRVIAVRGRMDEAEWKALIEASHWLVSVTKAEGLCLPMQTFMSAGRPVISPIHSALKDYVDKANALIVASDEEAWVWPDDSENEGWSWTQHPMDVGLTTRHRISWSSLSAAFGSAYRLIKDEPKRYTRMSEAARKTMQVFSGDSVVAPRLDSLLRLTIQPSTQSPPPSELMAGSPE